jgi:hypothetical protein
MMWVVRNSTVMTTIVWRLVLVLGLVVMCDVAAVMVAAVMVVMVVVKHMGGAM